MFYDNFVTLCSSIGKSPSAVALDIGFQKSAVSRWKKDGSIPTDANQARISDYFGVPTGALTADVMWECPECGLQYAPGFLPDVKAHSEFHKKWRQAKNKFGIWNYLEREKRYEYEKIEKDDTNPNEKRIEAAKGRIFAYFSRSVEKSKYDLSHILFDEYIPYFLYSQKQIFAPDIYEKLENEYGTKRGMLDTTWNCDKNAEALKQLNKETKKSASDNTDGTGTLTFETERLVRFPVIGSISAGYSGLAEEEYTGEYTLIPYSSLRGDADDYFILRVSGDSMYPRLLDGDKVLVRRTTIVDNGKVAVVLYNGDAATVKKVEYELGKSLNLIPYNPEFQVKTISGVDLEQCRILGEVVQLIRNM